MPRHHRLTLLTGCMLLAGASVLPALAQTIDAGAPTRAGVFPAAWFDDASPVNALDMVQRLPGFNLVEADADVRGYAGAAGNLLVDGARPTSKRQGTSELLKQIPARSVARIDLVYPGTPGIDMGGYPVLANVVLRHDASSEWTIEAGAMTGTDGWQAAQARLDYGHRWGDRRLDLGFRSSPELDDDSGHGRIDSVDGGGRERSAWDVRKDKRKQDLEAGWRQPLAGGKLSLDASARTETSDGITRIGPGNGNERIAEEEDFRETEVGARYLRQIGERTTLEAMATRQRGDQRNRERSVEGDEDAFASEHYATGEDIGRLDLTHAVSKRLSLQAGLEVARNTLESDNALLENGQAVDVPGARTRVEERRNEASLGMTWQPQQRWTLEAGMRLEQSALRQDGDGASRRSFRYPKPRVALRWERSDASQWRFALSREVGQLDFEDFAASASLDGRVVSAGNAELRPERSLRGELAWEWHPSTDAALTLGWIHERLEDVVDRVVVADDGDVFDAPGNIGDGRRDTLSLGLGMPLFARALPGTRLRASLLARDSRVRDPLTGAARRISEEKPIDGEIELTHELPAWDGKAGLLLEHLGERKTKYRFDRVTREAEDTGWTMYMERALGNGWRLRAEATDLFGRKFTETRVKYADRANGVVDETEQRRRLSPGTVSLSFRWSAGD